MTHPFSDYSTPEERDLQDIWFGMPEELREKISRMPKGVVEFYIKVLEEYAQAGYRMGARRERQTTYAALKTVTERFHPDSIRHWEIDGIFPMDAPQPQA